MKAVILAGGKGTRLRPLTCHLPKPMVPLLNRPCMEYIIELLRDHGITEIAVTVQYMPEVIHSYFGDGSDLDVRMHYFEETVPLGTAGSVKNTKDFLDERFIVISGDALTDFDLTKAVKAHESKEALATMVLTRVNDPLEYGIVMTDEDGRISRFLEKPDWSEVFSDTVNTGIYILEPEVLDYIPFNREYDFSNQLFPLLLNNGASLYGHVSEGYWSDIGNLTQYRQSQFDMLDRKVNVRIKGKEVQPQIFIGKNVNFHPGVHWVGPAFIGDNSQLEDDVEIGPYCVIGRNNRISKGSSLQQTILWDQNHIKEKNELNGTTLCSQIQCHPDSYFFDGSVIGSQCVIGTKTQIKSQVKVWPNKQIRDNTQLHSSLIWGDQASRTLYKSNGVSGIANVDMTPQFAVKFAEAYGSALGSEKTFTVSSCSHPFGKLMKQVIASGLASVGVNTIDLDEATPPVARYTIRRGGAQGGIHVQMSETNGTEICMFECYDEHGFPIAKKLERKVENAFWQEDYIRSPISGLGVCEPDYSAIRNYLNQLFFEIQGPSGPRLKVAAAAHNPLIRRMLSKMMEHINAEMILLPASGKTMNDISSFIKEKQADFGIFINHDAKNLKLFTHLGEPVTEDQLSIVKLMSYFQYHKNQCIGIPGSAPNIIEYISKNLGNRAVRTKENARAIMEVSPELDFHPLFDALYAAGMIARHISDSGVRLADWLQWIPRFSLYREHIECPWEAKGKIMRMMMELTKGRQVELLDGIKFHHDRGWVLLLPDTDDPIFVVIAHAEQPEYAKELIDSYREQIINCL